VVETPLVTTNHIHQKTKFNVIYKPRFMISCGAFDDELPLALTIAETFNIVAR